MIPAKVKDSGVFIWFFFLTFTFAWWLNDKYTGFYKALFYVSTQSALYNMPHPTFKCFLSIIHAPTDASEKPVVSILPLDI